MTNDLHALIASALTVLAASACAPSGGPYDGDYGECAPDTVDALPLVVVEAYVATEGDWDGAMVFGEGVHGEEQVQRGEDALVCVEVDSAEAPDCEDGDAWRDARDYGARHISGRWGEDWSEDETCGPMELDGRCCWIYSFEQWDDSTVEGRPFLVDGSRREASAQARPGWCGREQPAPVPDAVRGALISRWLRAARAEHASVASFARFALALMHHGAPAGLVAEAHRAALDEVRHAETCFALASAYAGQIMGPGPLDVSGALSGELDLVRMVETLVAEGCVGETLAALEAAEAARHADDPVVRAALEGIAEDESRHAALAWRALGWFVERHPELAAVAQGALAAHLEQPSPQPAGLAHHGCLSGPAIERVRRVGRTTVIEPLVRQVLGGAAAPGSWSLKQPVTGHAAGGCRSR